MGIKARQVISDAGCNYCNHSEYRDEYDGRDFYRLSSSKLMGSTCICVNCARKLQKLLDNTIGKDDVRE